MDQVLMGQSLCDEALAFAACGWPVFPCSPNDKRPLVGESTPGKGDAGLYRATCAAAEIRAWWQRWPDAMIAAATGAPIGAFVVDLDPKGGVAAGDLLEQLRLRCGGQLPPCPIARTPRGGLHLYYAIPTGIEIGNRTNILGAHKGDAMIDIRGTGGYVILPPSIRRGHKAVNEGCDRAPYSWQENAKFGALPIPEAPAALRMEKIPPYARKLSLTIFSKRKEI
jgi:putative DNA primase/helicase